MSYSRSYLLSLRFWWKSLTPSGFEFCQHSNLKQQTMKPLPEAVWNCLKSTGVLKSTRGTRGGRMLGRSKINLISAPVSTTFTKINFDSFNAGEPEQREQNNLMNIQDVSSSRLHSSTTHRLVGEPKRRKHEQHNNKFNQNLNIANLEEQYKPLLPSLKPKMAVVITNTSEILPSELQCGLDKSKTRKLPIFKLATINVRTAEKDSSLQNYINQLSIAKLDIIAVQEMHRLNSGSAHVKSQNNREEYNCFWSHTSNNARYSGVGLLVRVSRNIVMVEEPVYYSPRVMTCTMAYRGYKLRIVNVYAPTEDKSATTKRKFYKDVEKAISYKTVDSQLVVLGDFNATISAMRIKSNINHLNIHHIPDLDYNDNGELLLDLIRDHKLFNLNSSFEHKSVRRETRITPDPNKKNQVIDFINVSSNLRKLCKNCRVNPSIVTSELSDHRIVVATFRLPINRAMIKLMFKKPPPKISSNPINRLDKSAFRDDDVIDKFANAVELEISDQDSTSDLSMKLVESLKKAALATLPTKAKSVKKVPWADDKELQDLFEAKRSTNNKSKVKALAKSIKIRLRRLENEFYMKECGKLILLKESRQVEKEFKQAKEIATGSAFKSVNFDSLPIAELIKHFIAHFNLDPDIPTPEMPPELRNPPKYITDLRILGDYHLVNQASPDTTEIIKNINMLKNNKSAEDIPSEFLKYAQKNADVINCIQLMFRKIWEGEEIPADWGMARIEALFKNKGKRSDPSKYRGISIGSSVAKLFCAIIVNRLTKWYNRQLLGSQYGFRSGVGTVDAILKNKSIQRLAHKTGKTVYVLYIDLSAAFDRVIRPWVFESIRIRTPEGANTKIIDLLERFYMSTSCYLRQDPKTIFTTSLGVRQGGIESPSLFCWFLDLVMLVYESRLVENNIKSPSFNYRIATSATDRAQRSEFPHRGTNLITWTGFADDTTLYANSAQNLERNLEIIAGVYKDFHLSLNVDKTESMIFNFKGENEYENEYPKTIINLEDIMIQNSESFRFLGSMINYKEIGTGNVELNSRIQNAKAKFAEYKRLLTNYHIKLDVRIGYYNVFIRSRLTYGAQTWHLTLAQLNKIDAAHRKMLRRMIVGGQKRIGGDVDDEDSFKMKIGTDRLLEICKSQNISEFIRKQQTKFAAHIIRQPNSSQNKQLLFNDDDNHKKGHKIPNLIDQAVKNTGLSDVDQFARESRKGKF